MTADTKRVFWKCQRKGCRAVRVTDLPADNRGAYLPGEGYLRHRTGEWVFFTPEIRAVWTAHNLVCPEHNALMEGKTLNGTYNPDKTCDGRCMNAKRASCDCFCGGENHGRSFL